MHRVLLIYPPYERFRGLRNADFPLGLGSLATVLSQEGFQARLYNAEHELRPPEGQSRRSLTGRLESQDDFQGQALNMDSPIWRDIRQHLADFRPDLVGLYTTSLAMPIVVRLCALVKELFPGCPTVLGGPHATVMPEHAAGLPGVDYVIMGEGEHSLLELCRRLRDGRRDLDDIPGLGRRVEGETRLNRQTGFLDANLLPRVDRDLLLDVEKFPPHLVGGTVMGSRGCPHQCTFCASPVIWRRHTQYRRVDLIMEEIRYLIGRFGISHFSFWDDTMGSSRRKLGELCQAMIEARLGVTWECSTRIDLLDDQVLSLLGRAGCISLALGVESGSDRVLKAMKKGVDTKTIRQRLALARRHGMQIVALFMMGLPYEDADDIRGTMRLMQDIRPTAVQLTTFVPYPGTEAHDEAVRQGLLPADFAWESNLSISDHSRYNRFTNLIPDDEYRRLVGEAFALASRLSRPTRWKKLRRHWLNRHKYLARPGYYLGRLLGRGATARG